MGKVTIFFTRHGTSLGNIHVQNPIYNDLNKLRDCQLAEEGIHDISKKKKKKLEQVTDIDCIIVSPMKRTLQTMLLTYHDTGINLPIYVTPLVMECEKGPDCMGTHLDKLHLDSDLTKYKHFHNMNYRYFWYHHDHEESGEWWHIDYRMNIKKRMLLLKQVLSKKKFSGKRIHVFTHYGVIAHLFGVGVGNYDTVRVDFDQRSGNFTKYVLN